MVSGIGDPAIPVLIPAGSSSFVTVPQFTVAANKKRAAPDPVEPITLGGVRYEAVQFGNARGLEQNGGYITATTSVRLKREQIQLIALDAVVRFVFDSGNRLTEQHFFEERHGQDL